jgi:hypothetical protein
MVCCVELQRGGVWERKGKEGVDDDTAVVEVYY